MSKLSKDLKSLGKENDQHHLNERLSQQNQRQLLMIKKLNLNQHNQSKGTKIVQKAKDLNGQESTRVCQQICSMKIVQLAFKTNSQAFCHHYGQTVIEDSISVYKVNNQRNNKFLENHKIDETLRARMLDWMVEVMGSYKFNNKTYFAGVCIMDRYFQLEDSAIPVAKLHIIGVLSMLIATKMDEVYPLKIKTIYEKIVHKKIDRKELVDMEHKIAAKLDFQLNTWTFYDIAVMKIHCKETQELERADQLCSYIGKYALYSYTLCSQFTTEVLADALIKLTFDILEKSTANQIMTAPLLQINSCEKELIGAIRHFQSTFKGLANLSKFTADWVVQAVQKYIECS